MINSAEPATEGRYIACTDTKSTILRTCTLPEFVFLIVATVNCELMYHKQMTTALGAAIEYGCFELL